MRLRRGIFKIDYFIDVSFFKQRLERNLINDLRAILPIHTKSPLVTTTPINNPSAIGLMLSKFTNQAQTIFITLAPNEFTVNFHNQRDFDLIYDSLRALLEAFINSNDVVVTRFGFRKIMEEKKRFEPFSSLDSFIPNHEDTSFNTSIVLEHGFDNYRVKTNILYENTFMPARYSDLGEYILICDIDGVSKENFSNFQDLREIYHGVCTFMDSVFMKVLGNHE